MTGGSLARASAWALAAAAAALLPLAASAGSNDNTVQWDELYHNSAGYDPVVEYVPDQAYTFRDVDPSSLVLPTTAVGISILVDQGDITSANVVWSTGGGDNWVPLAWVANWTGSFHGQAPNAYDLWKGSIPAQPAGTTVYYRIQVNDGSDSDWLNAASGDWQNPLGQWVADNDTTSNNWSYAVSAWPVDASRVLAAGQWALVGLPCDPRPDATVAAVLGDDSLGTFDSDWRVYRHDPASGYAQLGLADTLNVGQGYWVKSLPGGTARAVGTTVAGPHRAVALSGAAPDGRFNLVGHPYDVSIPWPSVRVFYGGAEHTLQQAALAGVMAQQMWRWSGAAYQTYDPDVPGALGTLVPFDGFWALAYQDTELRIPSSATLAPPVEPDQQQGPWGWYCRLVVQSGDLVDPGNVLGQHRGSSRGPDPRDLAEMAPFGDDYLTVVFPHAGWGEAAGDYTVDYHGLRLAGTDEWTFEIRTPRPGREVTLTWVCPERVLERSQLVDDSTGDVRDAALFPEGVTLLVDGGGRKLTWRVTPPLRELPLDRAGPAPAAE